MPILKAYRRFPTANAVAWEWRNYVTPRLFESFIIQELVRFYDHYESEFSFFYWRTESGLEVECILARSAFDQRPIAIEIKSSTSPTNEDLVGLRAFKEEFPEAQCYCLCLSPRPLKAKDTEIASVPSAPKGKKCTVNVPPNPNKQAKPVVTYESDSKATVVQICASVNKLCQDNCNAVFPKATSWFQNYICIASCETAAGTCALTAQNCM